MTATRVMAVKIRTMSPPAQYTADALCVNQIDPAEPRVEKEAQEKMMRTIYLAKSRTLNLRSTKRHSHDEQRRCCSGHDCLRGKPNMSVLIDPKP